MSIRLPKASPFTTVIDSCPIVSAAELAWESALEFVSYPGWYCTGR